MKVSCTKIYRDKNKVIIAYDITDGKTKKYIKKEELKTLIKANKLSVDNLKLTNDGRLVSASKASDVTLSNIKERLKKAEFLKLVYQGVLYYLKEGKVVARAEDKAIKNANIKNGTDIIDENAFRDCKNLEKVVIPSTVIEIKEGAFENCTNLSKINFPDSLLKLGDYSFSGCRSLKKVLIPPFLIKTSKQAFWDRANNIVKKYWVPKDEFFKQVKCVDVKRNNNAIVGYLIVDDTTQKKWIPPEDLKVLLQAGKVDVVNLALVNGVITSKEEPAKNLNKTEILKAKIKFSADGVFKHKGLHYCLQDGKVAVKAGDYTEYKPYLKEFQILDGTEVILEKGFDSCEVEEISLPSTLREIGKRAFASCKNLKHIEVPEGVTKVSESAFAFCKQLETIKLPENLTRIEYATFSYCTKLVYLKLPREIKYIDDNAIEGCKKLTSIKIPKKVINIGISAFVACENLKEIVVDEQNSKYSSDDGILYTEDKSIVLYCPEGKEGNCKIPDGTLVIGWAAFGGCRRLTAIEMPDSLERIEKFAFRGCKNVQELIIPDSVRCIQSYIFDGCTGLIKIKLPAIKGIQKDVLERVFHECPNLKEFILPLGVLSIWLEKTAEARGIKLEFI